MERRLNSHSTTPEDMNTPVVQGHSAHHQQYRAPTFAGNLMDWIINSMVIQLSINIFLLTPSSVLVMKDDF